MSEDGQCWELASLALTSLVHPTNNLMFSGGFMVGWLLVSSEWVGCFFLPSSLVLKLQYCIEGASSTGCPGLLLVLWLLAAKGKPFGCTGHRAAMCACFEYSSSLPTDFEMWYYTICFWVCVFGFCLQRIKLYGCYLDLWGFLSSWNDNIFIKHFC